MGEVQARIGAAVRFLVLSVLLALSVVLERANEVRPLVLVLAVAAVASTLSLAVRGWQDRLALAEGIVAAAIVAAFYPTCYLGLPYLLVPVLVAAMQTRWTSPALVVAGEALSAAVVAYLGGLLSETTTLGSAVRTLWPFLALAVAAVPVALVGMAVGRLTRKRSHDDEATYRSAISLITQLDALSTRLRGGLDPVRLAESLMAEADVALPAQQAVVYTRGARGRLYPLRYSAFSAPGSFGDGVEELVERQWESRVPLVQDLTAAVPVRTPERTVAVLVVQLTHEIDQRSLEKLEATVRGQGLQLQAALLFDNVRASATSEERNRLAREVHDGVAQDVASLGYVVDRLTSSTTDPDQRERLVGLRTEVTRVVAELRASVYDLRNEMRAGEGLGQGVSAFARQIGSRSDLTVHVRLDEGATRLRPEVESELLRIAQEAMNNARRHSEGSNLWVSCTVRPPYAEIEVADDGEGMQPARDDSQGLRIMRERAERIDAELDVGGREGGEPGTRIRVRLAHT